MKVEVKILDESLYGEFGAPSYATDGSCGVDLRSANTVMIQPGDCIPISTGLAISCASIPSENGLGIGALILPRSGLGAKQGLVLGNTVGLIDTDYTGELIIAALNRNESETKKVCMIRRGDRIAQLVLVPFIKPKLEFVEEFSIETERGSGGYGSTGAA